jgi:hypothetical protein
LNPEITTGKEMVNVPEPVFCIVKVLSNVLPQATLPKSVWSVVVGVISPSKILAAFPCMLISGVNAITLNADYYFL